MQKVIFATGNKGKLKEVKKIFEGTDFEIVSPADLGEIPEVVEDADTFEGNARKKAEEIFAHFGLPVVADDSGLSVEQLEGRPGVYSARYAGENCTYDDNNTKLIKELSVYPGPHPAEFITCAVYKDKDRYVSATGILKGRITAEKRGNNGFGYDPVFIPDGHEKTLAEMELEEKNAISHRSIAFNELRKKIIKEMQ